MLIRRLLISFAMFLVCNAVPARDIFPSVEYIEDVNIPGHAEAALFSYPEYGCFAQKERIPETGFTDCIFCALSENNPLTMGMECALWTDYGLTEAMLESRLIPRIYALAELMWHGKNLTF